MKLTLLTSALPRLRMCGVLPPLPYMPSWHTQGHLNFRSVYIFGHKCQGIKLFISSVNIDIAELMLVGVSNTQLACLIRHANSFHASLSLILL